MFHNFPDILDGILRTQFDSTFYKVEIAICYQWKLTWSTVLLVVFHTFMSAPSPVPHHIQSSQTYLSVCVCVCVCVCMYLSIYLSLSLSIYIYIY